MIALKATKINRRLVLTLALFMARLNATNYPQGTLALDNLAVAANLLN